MRNAAESRKITEANIDNLRSCLPLLRNAWKRELTEKIENRISNACKECLSEVRVTVSDCEASRKHDELNLEGTWRGDDVYSAKKEAVMSVVEGLEVLGYKCEVFEERKGNNYSMGIDIKISW